jgi:hypothetical protein
MKAFTDGLTFKNGGLAHADYSMLERHLDANRIRALFGHFGIGPDLFLDYNDKECEKRATCSTRYGSVCTSNC